MKRALLAVGAAAFACLVPCACGTLQGGRTSDATLPAEDGHYVPGEVLVGLRHESVLPQVLDAVDGELLESYEPLVQNLYLLRVGVSVREAVRVLRTQPGVSYVHPNYYVHATASRNRKDSPDDPKYAKQWGMAAVNAPKAWEAVTSTDMTVAVIDSGIDPHEDLDGNLVPGKNFAPDKASTYTEDDCDHGTRVAGIIGAEGNNSTGVAGLNWSCKLMPLRFMTNTYGAVCDKGTCGAIGDAIDALKFAVAQGVKISNNSYGSPDIGDADGFRNAIRNAGMAGHLFVTAAGNDGWSLDEGNHFYPASWVSEAKPGQPPLDNMIVVAATDPNDDLMPLSNRGRYTVHIAAPGQKIYTTASAALGKAQSKSYGSQSGTSFATAFVTGVVAHAWGSNPSWSMTFTRFIVLLSGRPVSGLKPHVATGRIVDMDRARKAIVGIDLETDELIELVEELVQSGEIELSPKP